MESISDSQPINVDATTSTTTTTAISTTLAVKTARTETNESNSDTPAKRIRREESVKGDAVVPVSIVKPVDTAAAYVWFRKLGSPRYVVAPMVICYSFTLHLYMIGIRCYAFPMVQPSECVSKLYISLTIQTLFILVLCSLYSIPGKCQ